MGLSAGKVSGGDRISPTSAVLAPLWSTKITVFEAHFLSHFADVKNPPPNGRFNH